MQATPAGHAATAPKLTRQIPPEYSSLKDEQNPGQRRPVTGSLVDHLSKTAGAPEDERQ